MFGSSRLQAKLHDKDNEINKLTQILDNLDNIVILCDTSPENKIFYMNRAAKETLSKHHDALNRELHADVGQAFGNSIHQFHKNPDKIRKVLSAMVGKREASHIADIPMGAITLQTKTYPIWNPDRPNEVLCYMACWSDITAEKAMIEHQKEAVRRRDELEHNVAQISVSIEEMSGAVAEIARSTEEASNLGGNVLENAMSSKKVMQDAVSGMRAVAEMVRSASTTIEQLGDRSGQIGNIVKVIKEIAEQTNLLALNAAIEAARAGEQGRGFAVVADEVRKLAERTASSTAEIGKMIAEVQTDTKSAVQAMEAGCKQVEQGETLSQEAGTSLEQIVRDIDTLGGVINGIASSTAQQADAAGGVSRTLEEIVASAKH